MGCLKLNIENPTLLRVLNGGKSANPKSRERSYWFGYNGMEKDPEMKGDGNSYTTEFRQYDPRLGRWLSLDPLMEKFPEMSPFATFNNNPIFYTDDDGDSPISALAKFLLKKAGKEALKKFATKQVIGRMKNYMSKEMKQQFLKDLDGILSGMDDSWWEIAIEMVPVAGDLYGAGKYGIQIAKAYEKLQDLENKYVDKVYNSLDSKLAKKFKKSLRDKGVDSARKDRHAGVVNTNAEKDINYKEVEYIKGEKIDGHHVKAVKDRPDLMSDPRNIIMMKNKDHVSLHNFLRNLVNGPNKNYLNLKKGKYKF